MYPSPPQPATLRQRTLILGAILAGATALAQAQESARETAPGTAPGAEAEAEDPSRETDVSEDNYRRYMELQDRRLERPAFPAAALQPGGLQKMGELPESSQKHLRNQLRGIILQRGAWTPAEREKNYPFVPSAAARVDGDLLRREAEAWAELVAEYHDREEASLAARNGRPVSGAPGASGSGEALAAGGEPGAPGDTGGDTGSGEAQGDEGQDGGPGGGQAGEGDGEGQGGQQGDVAQEPPPDRRRPPEFSDEASPTTESAMSDEGVSESAAELLRRRGLAGDTPAGDRSRSPDVAPEPPDPGRWGEASTTLLPPPAESVAEPPAPASVTSAAENPPVDRAGLLTVEELRRARGVRLSVGEEAPPPESEGEREVGGAFDVLIDAGNDETASPEPDPEDGEG